MKRKRSIGIQKIVILCFLVGMFTGVNTKVRAASTLGAEYDGTYGYSTLKWNLKEPYKQINAAMEAFHVSDRDAEYDEDRYVAAKIDLSKYRITVNELNKLMFAINADHPRYYWYAGTSYTYRDLKHNQKADAGKEYVDQIAVTVDQDFIQGSYRVKSNESLYQAVRTYAVVLDGMKQKKATALDRERYIHDTLIKNIKGGSSKSRAENSVIGAFVNRVAECEGYAKAFQLLANYAGIESVYAVGYGYEEGHAWNLVKVNGKWYNVDVAWDDEGNSPSFRYFNCLDDIFLVSHAYSKDFPEMYELPKVTKSFQYQYYETQYLNWGSKDLKTDDAFCSKVKKAVNAALGEGRTKLEFQVKEKHQAKFDRMWKRNEAAILKSLKKNGVFYEFYGMDCTDAIVTTSNSVIFTNEVSIRKYSVVVPKNKIYISEPSFSLCVEENGRKKYVNGKTTSQYKNGKMTVYYKGTSVGKYSMNVKTLKVSNLKASYTYRGKKWCPFVDVYAGKTRLRRNIDYKVTYQNNVNAGKAKVIITGIGKYSGKKTVKFNIKKRSISSCSFTKVKKQKYTGRPCKPKVTVRYKGKKLKNNKDYKIRYYNNRRRGTGYLVIQGTGKNYTGRKTIKFKIV